MTTPIVYLSGPITLPATAAGWYYNRERFLAAQSALMQAGFSVINPGLSMYIGKPGDEHPLFRWCEHADWMAHDLPQVKLCDAVLRLPGESCGADQETHHARYGRGKVVPVFHEIEELIQAFGRKEQQ